MDPFDPQKACLALKTCPAEGAQNLWNNYKSTSSHPAQLACTNPATDPIAFPARLPLPLPLRGPAVRIDGGLTG